MSAVSRSGMPSEEPGPVMEKMAPILYASWAYAAGTPQPRARTERARARITRIAVLLFGRPAAGRPVSTMVAVTLPARQPRRVGSESGLNIPLHLDHRAVVEAQPDEELAHVGLGQIDQGRDLLHGPQLAPALDELADQRLPDAPPAVGRVHADQV